VLFDRPRSDGITTTAAAAAAAAATTISHARRETTATGAFGRRVVRLRRTSSVIATDGAVSPVRRA